MPIFFQHQINETTRLGIWKIEETEDFFLSNVPLQKEVTHPHKRLQHLAGRFLLQFLFPDFPYELIQIATTRKPFLPGEQYHFSISHCGDYAAAIVSSRQRVGIDIELPAPRIGVIAGKFLSSFEKQYRGYGNKEFLAKPVTTNEATEILFLTFIWSAKEAIFKWYGLGEINFAHHISLQGEVTAGGDNSFQAGFIFTKAGKQDFIVHGLVLENLMLAWVAS